MRKRHNNNDSSFKRFLRMELAEASELPIDIPGNPKYSPMLRNIDGEEPVEVKPLDLKPLKEDPRPPQSVPPNWDDYYYCSPPCDLCPEEMTQGCWVNSETGEILDNQYVYDWCEGSSTVNCGCPDGAQSCYVPVGNNPYPIFYIDGLPHMYSCFDGECGYYLLVESCNDAGVCQLVRTPVWTVTIPCDDGSFGCANGVRTTFFWVHDGITYWSSAFPTLHISNGEICFGIGLCLPWPPDGWSPEQWQQYIDAVWNPYAIWYYYNSCQEGDCQWPPNPPPNWDPPL